MSSTRILAVDFGSKRVGLALTDPLGITIQSLPVLKYSTKNDFLAKLKALVREKKVEKIVLGLPISLDGSLGPQAIECQALAEKIRDSCPVPVDFQDESFTSRQADEILIQEFGLSRKKRKEARDSLAACLILKYYLSSLGPL